MLTWHHSGFSVDASVRISPSDRDVPASDCPWEKSMDDVCHGQGAVLLAQGVPPQMAVMCGTASA